MFQLEKCPFMNRFDRWKILVFFASLLALFVLFLCSILIICLPSIIENQVRKSQLLVEDSLLFQRWTKPNYKIQSFMYPYSVKNPDDIISNNATPIVVKRGPYVFDQRHIRKIHSVGNDTVKYETFQTYHFNEALSCTECFLHNRIWIPNLVFQKFIEATLIPSMKAPSIAALILQKPFLEVEIGELLFDGYADPFLDQVCSIPFVNFVCEKILDLPERIALFFKKNGTSTGLFEVKGGDEDSEELGKIITWNNMNKLPENWWDNMKALEIAGTDGSVWPPYIEKNEALHVFVPDMCRSISLVFQKEVEFEGILAYRFIMPIQEWNWTRKETQGFCHHKSPKIFYSEQNGSCLPTGLLDVSRCQRGEPPIVVSMPNFLYTPDYVQASIEGMEGTPVQERDQIEIDIEPRLGAIIAAHRRFQINIAMWKGQNLTIMPQDISQSRDSIVPVLEIDERVQIDDENLSIIKSKLINLEKAAKISLETGVILSLLSILGLTLFTVFRLRRRNVTDSSRALSASSVKYKDNSQTKRRIPDNNGKHVANGTIKNRECNLSQL